MLVFIWLNSNKNNKFLEDYFFYMETKDYKNIYQELGRETRKGKIILLDAPTGSGKSHNIISFLCNKALEDLSFIAFFVTDQKKNLGEDKFYRCWDGIESANKVSRHKKIAVLRSLKDTVELILSDYEKGEIPKNLLVKEFKESLNDLKSSFEVYKVLISKSMDGNFDWKEVQDKEYNFRKSLAHILSIKSGHESKDFNNIGNQNNIREYLNRDSTEESMWVYKVYPTINLEGYQIFLCTTDKFIRSYTPFFKRKGQPFLYSKLVKESLVVFDEFDGTKKKIWDKSIEDSLKAKSDLIVLFSSIYKSIDVIEKNIPEELKKIICKQNGYESLAANAKRLNRQFRLSYLYKVEKDADETSTKNYVIHTPVDTLISKNKQWCSHFDEKSNRVFVNHIKNDDLKFRKMLRQVALFIKKFNRLIFYASTEYMSLRNSRRKMTDSAMNQVDAYFSIYDALGLENKQIEMLMNIEVGYSGSGQAIKNDRQIDSYHEFQKRGLVLNWFIDSEKHDLQTKFNAVYFNITAENYMLSLISKCLVLGLSATARIPTVLDNYDLEYLEEKLGDNLLDGRNFLTSKTLEEFDYSKRYKEKNIQVKTIVVGIKKSIRDLIEGNKELLGSSKINEKTICRLDSLIEKEINKINVSNGRDIEKEHEFFKERYIALFDSFLHFIIDPQMTSFLGLQFKLPDKSSEMSKELIEKVFEELKNQLINNNDDKDKLKLCIIATQNGGIEKQIDYFKELMSKGYRVYLLSAYLSIGVGQNLQHEITKNEKKFSKNIASKFSEITDSRNNEIDLAGMYLGNVTNILTNLKEISLSSDMLKYITELEYLQDANEIDNFEVRKKLEDMMNNPNSISHPKNLLSKSGSYVKYIVQALGRMNRTFNKVKNPKILVASEVVNNVDYLGLDSNRFSPEFQSIMDWKDNSHIEGFQHSKLENEKSNLTSYSNRDIHQLLGGLRNNEDYLSEYNKVRKIIFENPTINRARLIGYQKEKIRCMQYLPNENSEISYQVEIDDLEQGKFKFDNELASTTISAVSSGLNSILKYPGMKSYFKENNYPIEWKPNDYIISPIQFINVYCGMLGEVSGKFIFESEFNVKMTNFENIENFELFDFKIDGRHVAVDFKNWRLSNSIPQKEARIKVENKLKKLDKNTSDEWKVIVLNILGKKEMNITKTVDNKIMEVPAIIDDLGNFVLNKRECREIEEFVFG